MTASCQLGFITSVSRQLFTGFYKSCLIKMRTNIIDPDLSGISAPCESGGGGKKHQLIFECSLTVYKHQQLCSMYSLVSR